MDRQPRLKTIEMVKETIKKHDREFSIYQLWKNLPKKIMYQTYKNIINYLQDKSEIAIDGNKKLFYIKHTKIEMISRDQIIYNLSHYGYPLISIKKIKRSKLIPLNDLIIKILILYPEARFIESIPILLIKNKINQFELYRKAYDYELINILGFLLNISFIIAKKIKKDLKHLKNLLNHLKLKKEKEIKYLSNIKDKTFLDRTTPKIMKLWNLRGRFSVDDFHKEAYL